MISIKLKKDDRILFPEHSIFTFLQDECDLIEGRFIYSEDITNAFNEYIGAKGYYAPRYVIRMILKIFPTLKKSTKRTNKYGVDIVRRGLKGIVLTNKEF